MFPRSIRVRPATLAEAPTVVSIVESAYRGDESRKGWTTEADLLDGQRTDLDEIMDLLRESSKTCLLAAEADDGIVGTVLVRNEGSVGYVGMLAVRPDRQGEGVGKVLLEEAERALVNTWDLGRSRITVIRQREDILQWYERRGYRHTGRKEAFPYGNERFGKPRRPDLEFVVLEKTLFAPARASDALQHRETCPRCRRPSVVCYCRHLACIDTKTRVVLLQHPRERYKPIGTAHMASLCLPKSELYVGAEWSGSAILQRILSDKSRPAMLLYPGEGAVDPIQDPPAEPITLIVVDGTWSHTKKMVKRCPELAALKRLAFVPPWPGEYRIRKEPDESCVSTIEALAHVLGALEGDRERFLALLPPFRAMVEMQIACRDRLHEGRTRNRRRVERRDPALSCLRERAEDLVCVAGEANAWPYGSPERDKKRWHDEIVHWMAYRTGTKEVFEFVVAPVHPLSPSTPLHVGLAASAILEGGTASDLARKWRAFVRDADVVTAWGSYATSLFLEHGGYLPAERVDVRRVAREFMKRRVGTVETFLANASLGSTQQIGSGRAGRRLACLVAAIEYLQRSTEPLAGHRDAVEPPVAGGH